MAERTLHNSRQPGRPKLLCARDFGGGDGTLAIINNCGATYSTVAVSAGMFFGNLKNSTLNITSSSPYSISVHNAQDIWVTDGNYAIWRIATNGTGETQIAGPQLKQVSVAANGDVWGVRSDNVVYRWNGNGWTATKYILAQVAAGNPWDVWGLSGIGNVYRFQ